MSLSLSADMSALRRLFTVPLALVLVASLATSLSVPARAQIDTDVSSGGGLRLGASSTPCAAGVSGAMRYNAPNLEICNGTSWVAVGGGFANPMTTTGDVIYGGTSGAPTRLAGAAGFLRSTGAAAPSWSALAAGDIPSLDAAKITSGTFADARIASAATWNAKQAAVTGAASTITAANLTANRALLSDASGKVATSTVTNTELGYLSGVTSAVQTQLNGKMTNPMTVTGDVIYGGTSGAPTRLAGAAGFLKSTGAAAPTWSALAAGDIPNLDAAKITSGTFADARIASAATWNAKIANPMTTTGDVIYGGASGAPTRLAGAAGFLKSTGAAAPAWSALAAGDIPNLDAAKITTGAFADARIASAATWNAKQAAITGAASTITAANLTANRALLSDASGKVAASTVTNTELGYLSGVTSAVQPQLNGKMTNPMTATGDVIYGGTSGVPTRLAGAAGFLKSTGAAVPVWSALAAGDIPNLDAAKIATGAFADARIASAATWNAKQSAITGAASTITAANLTVNRALLSDAGGKVAVSAVTHTELGHLSGVTSAVQTQLNGKMTNPMTATGDVIYGGASGAPTRLAGAAGFLKSAGAAAPSWSALAAGDIPSLDASKITTGTFADARIASAATWNAKPGGSGTANYTARWTAASTLGAGILRDDGTYVGIGTAPTSTTRLRVSGGAHFESTANPANGFLRLDNDGYAYMLANRQTRPSTATASGGLAVGWNYTGGQADVGFWNMYSSGAAMSFRFYQMTGSGSHQEQMAIDGNGSVLVRTLVPGSVGAMCYTNSGGWQYIGYCPSSRRFKKDIEPLADFEKVLQLQPVRFKWKSNGKIGIGVIAEDAAAVVPDLAVYDDATGEIKSFNYDGLAALTLGVVKKQQEDLEALRGEVARLRGLEARFEALEARLAPQ